jgi:serine/threonine-protein kinase
VRRPDAEQRRHLRLNVALPARRKTPDGWAEERLLNLSASGLGLYTLTRLRWGAIERIAFAAPDDSVHITLDAEVMRVHATAKGDGYVIGLRFTYLDAQAVDQLTAVMLGALQRASGQRTSPRLEVHAEVFWTSAGYIATSPIELLNVSQSGALLQGAVLPAALSRGLLSLRPDEGMDLITVPAEIVWRRAAGERTMAGVRFGGDPQSVDLIRRIIRALLMRESGVSAAPVLPAGTRIGDFELVELLQEGRQLELYLARPVEGSTQTAGAAEVVIKRYHGPDVALWTERFLAAARAGAHLHNHPGVVRVYQAMADIDACCLVTERVKGASVDEQLKEASTKGEHLSVPATLTMAQQLLVTLEDCHHYLLNEDGGHLEVLHGDLRPSNVLVTDQGAVKLTGFGTPFETTPERLPYVPPEVLEGKKGTAQSDVYQVGVLLYEALTGVLPFVADSPRALLGAILAGPTAPSRLNVKVAPAIDAVVLSALSADPTVRPSGAGAFAEALVLAETAAASQAAVAVTAPSPKLDVPSAMPTDEMTALGGPLGGETNPRATVIVAGPQDETLVEKRPTLEPTAETRPVVENTVETLLGSVGPAPEMGTDAGFKRGQKVEPWVPVRSLIARGDTIGRYSVLGKLAEGGMAELFLARAPGQRDPLVVKTIHPGRTSERDVVTMFMTEARLASRIHHANVVRILDVGFDRYSPFIAMEYFAGRTLIEAMLELAHLAKPMPCDVAAKIIADCCAGLHHAHTLKDKAGAPLHIVHRDVTSKNLQIGYSGETKILDFGIARAVGVARLTRPGHVRGTAAYVSPEQINGGRVSPATDVWALGVNLYLMLTGSMPFGGKTDLEVLIAVKEKAAADPRKLRPDAPEALALAALKALQKVPGDRYATALEMRDDILKAKVASPAEVAALMESLFPPADPERARVNALLTTPAPTPDVPTVVGERSGPSALGVFLAAGAGVSALLGLLYWLLKR